MSKIEFLFLCKSSLNIVEVILFDDCISFPMFQMSDLCFIHKSCRLSSNTKHVPKMLASKTNMNKLYFIVGTAQLQPGWFQLAAAQL